MPLLNYTTQVPGVKSVGEIEGMLPSHGARRLVKDLDATGNIVGITFEVFHGNNVLSFKVPVKPEAVLKVLEREKQRNYRMRRNFSREQAGMIAWRIAKDWVEAQMALLETEMVDLEQIFLPYLVVNVDTGKTLYDGMKERQFLLTQGNDQR